MNLLKREVFQGFYYSDKNGEPTMEMTHSVHWLDETTAGFFYKTRVRKAFKYFKDKYPELINFVKLF